MTDREPWAYHADGTPVLSLAIRAALRPVGQPGGRRSPAGG